jgi:hypothetical protein
MKISIITAEYKERYIVFQIFFTEISEFITALFVATLVKEGDQ